MKYPLLSGETPYFIHQEERHIKTPGSDVIHFSRFGGLVENNTTHGHYQPSSRSRSAPPGPLPQGLLSIWRGRDPPVFFLGAAQKRAREEETTHQPSPTVQVRVNTSIQIWAVSPESSLHMHETEGGVQRSKTVIKGTEETGKRRRKVSRQECTGNVARPEHQVMNAITAFHPGEGPCPCLPPPYRATGMSPQLLDGTSAPRPQESLPRPPQTYS